MKKLSMVARILLGLCFFVFGLNGFLNFIPMPPVSEKAGAFLGALVASGYFFPFLKGLEVICGALLLAGAFVPLSLVVLAPILANIFLFHLFLAPEGLALPIFMGVLEIYLAFFSDPYSSIVKQIFRCPMWESMQNKKK